MFGKKVRRKQQYHLLRIPGEIRNQIYSDLLLSSPHAVPIYRGGGKKAAAPGTATRTTDEVLSALTVLTALLRTCRQIHREAGTLFYSRARFALPPDASRAPHQAQVNLLFRAFLDRIGPRNAALIRHLAIPFPVDPDLFLQHASLFPRRRPPGGQEGRREPASGHTDEQRRDEDEYGNEYGDEYDGDDDDEDAALLLITALRRRCPALETLTFDLRCNNSWARRLLLLLNVMTEAATRKTTKTTTTMISMTTTAQVTGAAQAAALRLFGPVDSLLRAAFPRLKRVDLLLGAGVYRNPWADPITPAEAAWLQAVLGSEMEGKEKEDKQKMMMKERKKKDKRGFSAKWDVTVEDGNKEERGGSNAEAAGSSSANNWRSGGGWEWWGVGKWYGTPRRPRHAIEVLYGPPAHAVRSEMHDQWTSLDVGLAYLRLAIAWLRSPTRAVLDREEAVEWKRWRRAMLANAAPRGRGTLSLKSLRVGGGSGRRSLRSLICRKQT
ncbi:hypothetical protein MYCTH_2303159 [Thermothelomyces thermophilus ATCC 42464]|uniref:F-box domain-containing protein n=1 Tax=Thermothelomyces thermophilus (strain ATCC 42464 / BCRC 31852 / DSM 1799) TaxID=573729 RepID=G2QC19_THET4|nr:uncharacterized protein MYCTH_2303159 [Thermothelomyces thermophilus ATCC 42464]AEO57246.1 hypothetical protein MYCTH_2303159 [Thermothelomyces thermophilus ATCC 42464]